MDPNETYRLFCVALLNENADDAREAYADLRAWLERDGFEPLEFSTHPFARKQFFTFSPQTGRLS
jgi:hypothetical protein